MKKTPHSKNRFTLAVMQASPVFMDRKATVKKACKLIEKAAKKGADVVLFPEAFIPGYPDWIWQIPPGDMPLNQKLYAMLLKESVSIESKSVSILCQTAKQHHLQVVIGINEKNTKKSGNSIYNTLLFISKEGKIYGKHQKLIPTLAERTIWAYGDAKTVTTYNTPLGKIGGLICWENYMPLVRYALYERGIELYLAPTYDEGKAWGATIQHIAKEGRCYTAGCCMVLKKKDVLAKLPELEPYYKKVGKWINKGNSLISDPNGTVLAGPVSAKEAIITATIDLNRLHGAKWNLDVAGHYARPDAFTLCVHHAS